jgi:hypothetical protein
MKLNKKAGQSVDASNLFRMGNKIMMGGRGREGSQWEMRGEEKNQGNRVRYGTRQKRSPECQEND